ncbi:hypothetical protein YC2023_008189 [Brassica napus]
MLTYEIEPNLISLYSVLSICDLLELVREYKAVHGSRFAIVYFFYKSKRWFKETSQARFPRCADSMDLLRFSVVVDQSSSF